MPLSMHVLTDEDAMTRQRNLLRQRIYTIVPFCLWLMVERIANVCVCVRNVMERPMTLTHRELPSMN